MSIVTQRMLRKLAKALDGEINWWELSQRFSPVVAVFERSDEAVRDKRSYSSDLVDFLDGQIQQVLENRLGQLRGDRALKGLLLWREYFVRPLIVGPLEEDLRFGESWAGVPNALLKKWQARYGLAGIKIDFPQSQASAYRWMAAGRELLARHLNGTLIIEERADLSGLQAKTAYREAMIHRLSWLPVSQFAGGSRLADRNYRRLQEVYVEPSLVRHSGHQESPMSASGVLGWTQQRGLTLILGESGVGKSALLRWLSLRLLEDSWLPVWLDPKSVPDNPDELVVHLTGQLGINYGQAKIVVDQGLKEHRIVLLADEGENWTDNAIRRMQRLRGDIGLGGLVAGQREGGWYEHSGERLRIVWNGEQLLAVMRQWGSTDWWPTFEAWRRAGRLRPRPWEFSIAARVPFDPGIESPVAILTKSIAQWQEDEKRRTAQGDRYVKRQMAGLMRRSWVTVIEGRRRPWRPTGKGKEAFANWGVSKGILERTDSDEYWFTHGLWRDFLAARHGYRNLEPKKAVAQLVGVEGWEQVVAWMAELALDDGGIQWAEEMLLALANAMQNSWESSGWLQGASASGALLRTLQGKEVASQVKFGAEIGLIKLLSSLPGPWNAQQWAADGIGDALLALSPLSEKAVDRLMNLVYRVDARSIGWEGLRLTLAGERTVALRLLRNPGRFAEETGPRWLWAVARVKLVSEKWGLSEDKFIDRLLEAAGRVYHESTRDSTLNRTQAVIGALSTRGTEIVAQRLGQWLRNEQPRMTGEWYDGWDRRIRDGLQEWRGDLEHLWQSVLEALQTDMPWLAWRACLMGAMDVSKAEGAVRLVALAERIGIAWTEERWEDNDWKQKQEAVLDQLKAWGDERVVSRLLHWWETAPRDNFWRARIRETLWGTETNPGVLGRQETGWLIHWLRSTTLSDDVRVTTATWILCQRRRDQRVKVLGWEWLRRDSTALRQAGVYLVDRVVDEQLNCLLGDEQTSAVGLCLAARMDRWEIVQPYVEQRLATYGMDCGLWDLIAIAGEVGYKPFLPLLVEWCVIRGKLWILDAGLLKFEPRSIDAVLKRILDQQQVLPGSSVYRNLWASGTPEAVHMVLRVVRDGKISSHQLGHLGRAYRERIWELLAEFLEEDYGEYVRWDVFGHLRSLWPVNEAWPWEVVSYFFKLLNDQDKDIREGAWTWLDTAKSVNWSGRETVYVRGIRSFALQGTDAQQRMGLQYLACMPSDVVRDALELNELTELLNHESLGVRFESLGYIIAHERQDLSSELYNLARWLEQEIDKNKQSTNGTAGESTEVRQRASQLSRLQDRLTAVLGVLEEAGEQLIDIALGRYVGSKAALENPNVTAVRALIRGRQHLDALIRAVTVGRVSRYWLVAALVAQDIILEEREGGGFMVRRGARRFTPKEWGQIG